MRFIHTADFHLGAVPDKGTAWSKARTQEIWDSVTNILNICNAEKVDLLLIAGDIFHKQPLVSELKDLNKKFEQLENTKVVMIAGNHDYLKPESKYAEFEWCRNVTMIKAKDMDCVYLEELNTYVYGFSYWNREITEDKVGNFRPKDTTKNNILLLHGNDAKHLPLNINSLQHNGFDYIALGHIHKPQVLLENRIAFCGSPEPIEKHDLGARGYIMGELEEHKTTIEFKWTNLRSYFQIEINADVNTTNQAIYDIVRDNINTLGAENIYLVNIKGLRSIDTDFNLEPIYELGNIVEIEDISVPDYDFDAIYEANRDNIIGRYIKAIIESGKSREIIEKALYYGMDALTKAKEGK